MLKRMLIFLILNVAVINGILGKNDITQDGKKLEEQHLQLIITSFNNAEWYKKNLDSVFMQNYSNYKVIYIDDCSTDNTAQFVEQYIEKNNQQDKWTLIKNDTWQSQMANHYKAVQMCDDDVICMHLDGDDWLASPDVFSIINETYTNRDVWLTAGRPIFSCSGQKWSKMAEGMLEDAIKNNSFRRLPFWPFTHLRTFRASLFKAIKLQDLLYKGTFTLMSPAPDLAFMLPMVEMAAGHIKILDEDLYVYNTKNALSQFTLNNEKVFSLTSEIYQWKPYQPIDSLQKTISKVGDNKIDVLILLSGNQEEDFGLCSKVSDGGSRVIACLYPIEKYSEENILTMKKQFPSIVFFSDSDLGDIDFKKFMNEMGKYVLVISNSDEQLCENDTKLARIWLEKTQADSCSFTALTKVDPQEKRIIGLGDDVYAYQPLFVKDLMIVDRSGAEMLRKDVFLNFLSKKDVRVSSLTHLQKIHSHIEHERSVKLFLDKCQGGYKSIQNIENAE